MPDRTLRSHASASKDKMTLGPVFEEVKKAMLDYYTLLSKMPYFPAKSLSLPPANGWDKVDVQRLKGFGVSDVAIEWVRHLPYIEPCINSDKAWTTFRSSIIPFHKGRVWDRKDYNDHGLEGNHIDFPLPPHVIFLSVVDSWQDENYLLLDTERGTIVEVNKPYGERTLTIPDEEYYKLGEKDHWTAHRTLPAAEFFAKCKRHMQQLLTMGVPYAAQNDSPKFYFRVDVKDDEEAAPPEGEGDWEPHPDDEWVELAGEAGEEGISEPAMQVYNIYTRNKWPDPDFQEQRCRKEIMAWVQKREAIRERIEGAEDADDAQNLAPDGLTKELHLTGDARLMNDQQATIQAHRAKGLPKWWDDEKEKTLTPTEWFAWYKGERKKELMVD